MSGNTQLPPGAYPDPISVFIGQHSTFFSVAAAAISLVEFWSIFRPYWLAYSVGRKLRFRDNVANVVRLSRTQTGYIGAFLAKKTVVITLCIFFVSITFNTLNYIKSISGNIGTDFPIWYIFIFFATLNSVVAFHAALFVFYVCREIVAQIEEEDKRA